MMEESIKMFKVLVGWDKKNLNNIPTEIPWDMLNEVFAQSNHSQTLTRLNERGGLSVTEILANIHKQRDRDWTTTQETVDELNVLVETFHINYDLYHSSDYEAPNEWDKDIMIIELKSRISELENINKDLIGVFEEILELGVVCGDKDHTFNEIKTIINQTLNPKDRK